MTERQANKVVKTEEKKYAVTGDFARMIYSRHATKKLAEIAAKRLAKKWGKSHPGSEPRVIKIAE